MQRLTIGHVSAKAKYANDRQIDVQLITQGQYRADCELNYKLIGT